MQLAKLKLETLTELEEKAAFLRSWSDLLKQCNCVRSYLYIIAAIMYNHKFPTSDSKTPLATLNLPTHNVQDEYDVRRNTQGYGYTYIKLDG